VLAVISPGSPGLVAPGHLATPKRVSNPLRYKTQCTALATQTDLCRICK
jgi:hypothetical protein